MPDERRRYDRRRPSDAAIGAEHDRLVRAQQLAEIETTAERAMAPDGVRNASHTPEPAAPKGAANALATSEPADDARENTPTSAQSLEAGDAREKVRKALRRAIAGRGRRSAGGGRPAPPPPPPPERERVARAVGRPSLADTFLTDSQRASIAAEQTRRDQFVRDQTVSTFGTEEYRGLGGMVRAEPHWSERDNRGHRADQPKE